MVFRSIALFVSIFLSSCFVQAAQPDAPISKLAMVREFVLDSYLGFAPENCNPAVEEEIRSIIRELQFDRVDKLVIRKMNMVGRLRTGKKNAFVVQLPGQEYLYVSESWFKTLSSEEKKFLIGHEITHLKNYHTYKRIGLAISISVCALLSFDFLEQKGIISSYEKKLCKSAFNISVVPVSLMYSRYCEYEADHGAIKDGATLQGALGILQQLKEYGDKIERSLSQWKIHKLIRNLKIKLGYATHPEPEDRIAFVKRVGALLEQGDTTTIPFPLSV